MRSPKKTPAMPRATDSLFMRSRHRLTSAEGCAARTPHPRLISNSEGAASLRSAKDAREANSEDSPERRGGCSGPAAIDQDGKILADGGVEAVEERAADEGVADRDLVEVRQLAEQGEVLDGRDRVRR